MLELEIRDYVNNLNTAINFEVCFSLDRMCERAKAEAQQHRSDFNWLVAEVDRVDWFPKPKNWRMGLARYERLNRLKYLRNAALYRMGTAENFFEALYMATLKEKQRIRDER